MKWLRIVTLVMLLQASGTAFGQAIDPPNCPIGYHCIPTDSLGIDPGDQDQQRRQARAQCEERKRAEEQLLAGQAAMADPGNPYAVNNAIGIAGSAIECGD